MAESLRYFISVRCNKKVEFKCFGVFVWWNSIKEWRVKFFYSFSPDSFFPPLNTEGGKTNNKGSKKNPAFALTLKTIKQQ